MGIKIRVNSVEVIRPPMTVIAMGALIAAPSPNPSAIGRSPNTVVDVVIRIGRSSYASSTSALTRPRYESTLTPKCPISIIQQ